MAFDTSELDAACLDVGFSDEAEITVDGESVIVPVVFEIGPEYENDEGVKIKVGDRIAAGTTTDNAKLFKRGMLVTIMAKPYKVSGFEPDGATWVNVLLDKVL